MTDGNTGSVKNVAASVRQRLMNLARARAMEFQRVLVLYALERLLYRLSTSPFADRFILKGASLFSLWLPEPHRRTRDVDLLGSDDPSPTQFAAMFEEMCSLPVAADDGLRFLAESVKAKSIREENEFGGVRVTLTATLENARIALQVDIGFGDAAVPEPESVEFPLLLEGFPAPRLRAYQKETTIAEKLHALVTLERANSRMKNFFDLYVLAQEFAFTGDRLVPAVRNAFAKRKTKIPMETPDGLTQAFASDLAKQTQWKAFLRQSVSPPRDTLVLPEVIEQIALFLEPILTAAREKADGTTGDQMIWSPKGPWKETIKDAEDER